MTSRPLLYDHREERSNIPGLLALQGFELEARQLPVGDYVLSDRMVVERKTVTDLVASIKDRRLWEQAGRLQAAYPLVVLIIEGDVVRFPEAAWKGALASVMTMGPVGIIRTDDADDTVDWLARLAKRERTGPSESRGAKRKSKEADRLAESVLASLPGISTKGAQRLLTHFGSLGAVFAAGEKELRAVEGIGPKRARDLTHAFERPYPTPAWSS